MDNQEYTVVHLFHVSFRAETENTDLIETVYV